MKNFDKPGFTRGTLPDLSRSKLSHGAGRLLGGLSKRPEPAPWVCQHLRAEGHEIVPFWLSVIYSEHDTRHTQQKTTPPLLFEHPQYFIPPKTLTKSKTK